MRLLHFRRTFVEKMFAVHSKVELLQWQRAMRLVGLRKNVERSPSAASLALQTAVEGDRSTFFSQVRRPLQFNSNRSSNGFQNETA